VHAACVNTTGGGGTVEVNSGGVTVEVPLQNPLDDDTPA